jgi:hypothetical protein
MKPSIWDILTGILVLGIVCLACSFSMIFINPTAAYNPFPPPTALPALVVEIPPTATATALRQLPATWTPVPPVGATATLGVMLKPSSTIEPTATLYVMPTATNTATVTRTPGPRSEGRCQVVSEYPVDNTEFARGQEFDKRWTVRNTSGETWRSDSLDIRYLNGANLQTGATAYDLPRDVFNGESYDVVVRMRAPNDPGVYTANWGVTSGDNKVCGFFIKIVVK